MRDSIGSNFGRPHLRGEVDNLDVYSLVLVELWRHRAEAELDLVPLPRDVLPVDVGDVHEVRVDVLSRWRRPQGERQIS